MSRVPDAAGHRVIGLEVIVDDDAAAKALGQVAAFGRHPIRGQGAGLFSSLTCEVRFWIPGSGNV